MKNGCLFIKKTILKAFDSWDFGKLTSDVFINNDIDYIFEHSNDEAQDVYDSIINEVKNICVELTERGETKYAYKVVFGKNIKFPYFTSMGDVVVMDDLAEIVE